MTLVEHVRGAIDEHERRYLLSALVHACSAIDATAERLFPDAGPKDRFVGTIDQYLWLIEPLLGLGINLEASTFSWDFLPHRPARFSAVLYEIFRHKHPFRPPPFLELRRSTEYLPARFARRPTLPDTVTFALLAAVVFAPVNSGERIGDPYYLRHGSTQFPIDEWWGREADARAYIAQFASPRIVVGL